MPISRVYQVFHQHADAERSAPSDTPAPDANSPDQAETAPVEDPARSTLGENWPPNLHSHETDWVVLPEPDATRDADRPMM
jgi:hypothetical protein